MHSCEIVALTTSGNRVRQMVSSQDDAIAGQWDADRYRLRTRNTRHSNAQCTNVCICKSPTFSLRTLILLPALSSWLQPEVNKATLWPENASGQTVSSKTPQLIASLTNDKEKGGYCDIETSPATRK